MLKCCYFRDKALYLISCGYGRGKLIINCGKYSPKYISKYLLGILIYDKSIETKLRKRRLIQLFSTEFLKI